MTQNTQIDSTKVWKGQIVTRDALLNNGAVVSKEGTIVWVGAADELPAEYAVVPATEAHYVLPGCVDIHCHGGGGESFPDATDRNQVLVAARDHLTAGTTTLVASLVTADVETLETRSALLASVCGEGALAGIHFEGPFLNEVRCGAQNPAFIRPATTSEVNRLATAAGGFGVTMTVAAENAGTQEGREAIKALLDNGILPSWGHTDASLPVAEQAVQYGTEVSSRPFTVTHLFNGMPPMHHRLPGPIPAFLSGAQNGHLVVELIADGVHLDTNLVGEVFELLDRGGIVLVTDSMAAAGMPDGSYRLGPQDVTVEDGVARLTEGGALAGGTSHLWECVRNCVNNAGVSLVDAVFAASARPAEVIGKTDIGEIAVGKAANIIVADSDLQLEGVWKDGHSVR